MSPTFLSFTISLKVKRTLNFFSILFISCMLVSESHPSTSVGGGFIVKYDVLSFQYLSKDEAHFIQNSLCIHCQV